MAVTPATTPKPQSPSPAVTSPEVSKPAPAPAPAAAPAEKAKPAAPAPAPAQAQAKDGFSQTQATTPKNDWSEAAPTALPLDARDATQREQAGGSMEWFSTSASRATGTAAPLPQPLALGNVAENPKVQAALQKMGIDPAHLEELGAAKPHLIDAAKSLAGGQPKEALGHLADAVRAAPELSTDLATTALNKVAAELPDDGAGSVAKTLLTNRDLVKRVITDTDTLGAVKQLADGDLHGGLTTLTQDGSIAQTAIDALGGNTAFTGQLAKLGLNVGDVKQAVQALPDVVSAVQSAAQGDFTGAISHLADAVGQAPDLVTKGVNAAAAKLPDGGASGIAKSLLGDKDFVRALAADPASRQALPLLAQGKVGDALRGLSQNQAAANAAVDALSRNPSFKAALDKMGITPDALKAGTDALPDLVEAGISVAGGDFGGAVGHLGDAAQKAPELVAQAAAKLADGLPTTGPGRFARALLKDPAFMQAVAGDPSTYQAIGKLAQGQVGEGLKLLAQNQAATGRAVDVIAADPQVKAGLEKLGLTPEALKEATAALPDLVDAGISAAGGDFAGALGHLGDAAQKSPQLVAQAAAKLADGLPTTGPARFARALLKDPAFMQAVAGDPGTYQAIGQLAQGKIGEGLKTLSQNQAAAQAAVDVIAADPQVKAGLDKLGITPDALKQATDALPDLVDAGISVAGGDFAGALGHLGDAAQKSPELVAQAAAKLADGLPSTGPARFARAFLKDPAFMQAVAGDPGTYQAIAQIAQGKVGEGLKTLSQNQAAARAAVDVLAADPQFKSGMDKLGLTADALKNGVAALPDLVDAATAAASGNLRGALGSLYTAATKAPEALSQPLMKAASKLSPTGPEGLLRSILTDPAAAQALISDTAAHQDVVRLFSGDLNALADLAQTKAASAVTDALLKNADVQRAMGALKLSPEDMKQMGAALPDLIRAGVAFSDNDAQHGFQYLNAAAKKLAPVVGTRLLMEAADRLPSNGPAGLVKALLSDRAFLGQLFTNPNVSGAFDKIVSGEFEAGFKQAMGDSAFRDAAGNALAKDQQLMTLLQPFGIQNGKDLSDIGGSLVDLMEAGEALRHGDIQGTLRAVGNGVKQLSPQLRARMLGAFADNLGLPPWAKDVMTSVGELLGNQNVYKALGGSLEALRRNDYEGFIKGIAETGRQLNATAPDAAKAFLNALGSIPGNLAKFFQDRQFNSDMVDSGAQTKLMDVFEHAALGQLGDAMNSLADTGMALLTQGGNLEIGGHKLPFSAKGLENMGRLAMRFFEVLPTQLKSEIAELAAKESARMGLKSIPAIGNIISGASAIFSGKDMIQTFMDPNKDTLDKILATAQFGLDVAGVFPAVNTFTGPAGLVLQMARMFKSGHDIIRDFHKYQTSMADITVPGQPNAQIPIIAKDAPRPAARSTEGWYDFPVQGAAPVVAPSRLAAPTMAPRAADAGWFAQPAR
ncbi:MAG TPA: hypothetical protein VIG99_08990 [Myxococcaceae bacterium]